MSALSPFRVVLVFSLVSLLSLAVLPYITLDLSPSPSLATLQVSYTLPQASPENVETQATSLFENVFSQLSNLKKISSISRYHHGMITLEFDQNADLAFKRFEVAMLIRRIYPQLPPNASYPQINLGGGKQIRQKFPILSYSINAPLAPTEIKTSVKNIFQTKLALLEGIEEVRIEGANENRLLIEYDLNKLGQWQISPQQVMSILQAQSQTKHLGSYRQASGQVFYLQTQTEIRHLQDLENLIIHKIQSPDNQVINFIRLKDVAKISETEMPPTSYYRINGLNSITLNLYARAGVNKLELGKQIQAQIQSLKNSLPPDYQLIREYDDTEYLSQELTKIYQRTGLSVLILTLLILVVQRNLWYLIVLFAGIAVNLGLLLWAVYLLNIPIHLYSLAGLTLSFGLIMDSSIVLLDHLKKHRNILVIRALLGATLTTLAALALVFGLPEEDQLNLRDFALIIILNLAFSLLCAIFFIPSLYQLGGRKLGNFSKIAFKSLRKQVYFFRFYYVIIKFIVRFRVFFNVSLILAFGLPIFLLPAKLENWNFYNQTIGSDIYQENIRPYIDKTLGGSLRLFVQNVYEKSGYRQPEKTTLYVNAEMPLGTTLTQMNHIIEKVEQYLQTVRGLAKFTAAVYSGQSAAIQIHFSPEFEKGFLPYQLKSQLIARSLDWGGVEWQIYGVGDGFSNAGGEQMASFRVEMRGYNYLALEKQAQKLAAKLLKHKRIQQVNVNERMSYDEKSAKEWVLQFNLDKLQLAKTSSGQITDILLQQAEKNVPDNYFFWQNRYLPIYWQSQSASEFSRFELFETTQNLHSNQKIKLNEIGQLTWQTTSNAIYKENRQYIRIIGFDYYGSAKFGDEYLEKMMNELRNEMPVGYEVKKLSYDFFSWEKNQRRYGLFIILMLSIFVICSILLESFRQPWWIILTIPIALIGLFLIFAWFGFYFDQGGYAAFFLLGGLVVNAAIFVINDFNNLKKIKSKNRRIIKALMHKAFPILLTIFSTILGLIPFLTEGDSEVFWFSLAIGSIGGLLFSLLAVFVALPVWMFEKIKN
ncbi:MAG: efflux RND transporter permease subunit [Microscillaceae bacterium]|jgi:multidrug efflux pump subunit AcrB|nr:efflux RND transporter permease subunit [Microscillaceae bacterium]